MQKKKLRVNYSRKEISQSFSMNKNWLDTNSKMYKIVKYLFGEITYHNVQKAFSYADKLICEFENVVSGLKLRDWSYIAYPESNNKSQSANALKNEILYRCRQDGYVPSLNRIIKMRSVVECFRMKNGT